MQGLKLDAVVAGSFGSVMFGGLVRVMTLDAWIVVVVTPQSTAEGRVRRICQGQRIQYDAQHQYRKAPSHIPYLRRTSPTL